MVRVLKVEGCIGCQACVNICPSELMIREQGESHLIVRFPLVCTEDCRLCQELCPAGAISLEEGAGAAGEDGGTGDVLLELCLCRDCGRGYATRALLERLAGELPAELQVDGEGHRWLELCPDCRRRRCRERTALAMGVRS